MDNLSLIKDFLDSIPGFISDLEPDNNYLKAEGLSDGIWKVLDSYSVVPNDAGNGFIVEGRLVVSLNDLIMLPVWHIYKSHHTDLLDDALYEMYLSENPNFCSKFDLKAFCDTFSDFYLEFLNDAGISEESLTITSNSIECSVDTAVSSGSTDFVEEADDEVEEEAVEEVDEEVVDEAAEEVVDEAADDVEEEESEEEVDSEE